MTTAPEIVHQLSEFVHRLDYESIPADVIHEARRCVLDLEVDGIADAMALALSNASGIKSTFGCDARPLGIGLVSSRGVDCACLAQHGLSGPDAVFEGPGGFLSLYGDDQHGDTEELRLGQRWRLVGPGNPDRSAALAQEWLALDSAARPGDLVEAL